MTNKESSHEESLQTASGVLAQMDALAHRLVARASPIRFTVAHSSSELELVHRLRYRVVIEMGWARPEDFPQGLERDAYDDDHAVQIVAWEGAVLAATSRLVPPAPGRRLPTEEAFAVSIGGWDSVVDVGRVCVLPAYREKRHRVLWGLLCQSWLEMRARGFTRACTVLTPAVARLYRSWGLQVVALGAPQPYWGEKRYPALMQPAELVDTLLGTAERS